ncbi:D-glycerate dehydrogenase [Jeotgalibacillus sp. R-1-5s-1]|uniref:2-hydroxyacid dehydrogenase n=1 Tax=Jeotgalibacillus sp. R-1-5s-1 TaxID=2555897 RepID=UPI00106BBFFC|nr:D-glycerate dehydrogenase [Jeotgalibacillus sp. R-1-5s-1]TFD95916.1 D-glycerate dehydrogenase [Jeotgalibacillus sp. R-1-5s-1]
MKKIYITRKIDDQVIDQLRKQFDVQVWNKEDQAVPKEELLHQVKDSHALLTMLSDRVDQEVFEEAPHLEVVANLAVGYDNIDLDAAKKAGVTVTNTPDVLTDTTADLTFSLIMAVGRRITEAAEYVKEGKWTSWSPYLLAGTDIHHKTIGIIGMGSIGQAVAQRAKGFDMDVLYHTRSRKPEAEQRFNAKHVSLEDLLKESDYVVMLAPFTEETKQMMGEKEFRLMKKSAYFVNAGRGTTVDEQALIEALQNGEIAGAALDVFEKEPISADHPLLAMKNVVAIPHIGSASRETRLIMMKLAADNIAAVLQGKEALTEVK